MKKFSSLALLVTLVVLYIGCQREVFHRLHPPRPGRGDSLIPCGNKFDTTLVNFNGEVSGSIEVMNDQRGYHVIIREIYADYKITRVQLLYGTKQHVIDNLVGIVDCATTQPRNPDTVINYMPDVDSLVIIDLPFDSLDCFFMNANITLAKRDDVGNLLHSFFIWSNGTANASQNPCQQYFEFCKQACSPTPGSDSCGPLRTQTQSGWGSNDTNSLTRRYLDSNFAAAFPGGLKVGCSVGFTVTMTSAQAITNLLPTDGKSEALRRNYTDPSALRNALVGELIALTLNVGFDKHDASFGQATKHLEDMYIKSGKFRGITVGEFLSLANKSLGKCGSRFNLNDYRETARKINENYKNGTEDKHRLVCHINQCDDHDGDDDDDDDDHDDHDHDH
jgi:hypothetical protein